MAANDKIGRVRIQDFDARSSAPNAPSGLIGHDWHYARKYKWDKNKVNEDDGTYPAEKSKFAINLVQKGIFTGYCIGLQLTKEYIGLTVKSLLD